MFPAGVRGIQTRLVEKQDAIALVDESPNVRLVVEEHRWARKVKEGVYDVLTPTTVILFLRGLVSNDRATFHPSQLWG